MKKTKSKCKMKKELIRTLNSLIANPYSLFPIRYSLILNFDI